MQVLNVSLTAASWTAMSSVFLDFHHLGVSIQFNHLMVSQLRKPVSVLPGDPPQELGAAAAVAAAAAAAAAEDVMGTSDTLGCSMWVSYV